MKFEFQNNGLTLLCLKKTPDSMQFLITHSDMSLFGFAIFFSFLFKINLEKVLVLCISLPWPFYYEHLGSDLQWVRGDKSLSLSLPMVCQLGTPASPDALPGIKTPVGVCRKQKKCQISPDVQESSVCCSRILCALISAAVLNQNVLQVNFVTFLKLISSPTECL